MSKPRVFISYSWSSADHEEFVLQLATQLRENGVDAVLDKWDLKEGQEATAFMEQMVSDQSVEKVVIISDRVYVEKSNERRGGAGVEAQIISKSIFETRDQTKFVALVTECNDDGTPCIPAYYSSRIFIDHTEPARATDAFEQLLRWIFDKPLHKKPEIGRPPKYLEDSENIITLATSAAARRALDALQNGKNYSLSATIEYFELFNAELEKFRFPKDFDPLADDVLVNFESFIPFRDEAMSVVKEICRCTTEETFADAVHQFLEGFIPYFNFSGTGTYRKFDLDNFQFFGHEMALHIVATLIVERRHDIFEVLLDRPYFDQSKSEGARGGICNFAVFRRHCSLLEFRNKQLGQRRLSLQADLLKQRCPEIGKLFQQIMQADLIIFLRFALNGAEYHGWYPISLLYATNQYGPFEIFARARSKREFLRLMPFLGLQAKAQIDQLMDDFAKNSDRVPRWDFDRLDIPLLIDHEKLATLP